MSTEVHFNSTLYLVPFFYDIIGYLNKFKFFASSSNNRDVSFFFFNVDRKTELKIRMSRARTNRVTKKYLKIIDQHRINRYNKNLSTGDILNLVSQFLPTIFVFPSITYATVLNKLTSPIGISVITLTEV